jgi:hypothetical protein
MLRGKKNQFPENYSNIILLQSYSDISGTAWIWKKILSIKSDQCKYIEDIMCIINLHLSYMGDHGTNPEPHFSKEYICALQNILSLNKSIDRFT